MDKIPEQYVNSYGGLIRSRVNLFYKKENDNYDDMMQEGYMVMCQSFHRFNPKKNLSFSAYLWNNLNYHFINYKYDKETNSEISYIDWSIDNSGEDFIFSTELKDLISKLSTEAKEVVSVIFSAPAEMMELVKSNSTVYEKKITRKLLINYFKNVKGWMHTTIFYAFSEIKTVLEIN